MRPFKNGRFTFRFNYLFIFFFFIIFSLTPSYNLASSKKFAYPATVDENEFIVYFPHQIKYTKLSNQNVVAHRYSSKNIESSPSLRVEFYQLSDRNSFINSLEQACLNHIQLSGFNNGSVAISDSVFGKKAAYDGFRIVYGEMVRLHGIIYAGKISMVHCMIIEPASSFPSEDTIFFINKIQMK